MDEARLTPQLGRLIDSAKAATLTAGPATLPIEGIALLTDKESIHSGCSGGRPAQLGACAAEVALAAALRAGGGTILAAAVAVDGDCGDSTSLSPESRRCLEGLNPDLPVVIKQRGRWVLLLLSQLPLTT